MSRENLINEIRKAAPDGRLSCEKAHALAKEMRVSLNELGGLCNELKIKISSCRLGCF